MSKKKPCCNVEGCTYYKQGICSYARQCNYRLRPAHKKKDMSHLAQALRWWSRQMYQGPIPSRHYGELRRHRAIRYCAYEGVCDLTPKGKKMIAALGEK